MGCTLVRETRVERVDRGRTRGHQLQKEADERHVLQDCERQQKRRRVSESVGLMLGSITMMVSTCSL